MERMGTFCDKFRPLALTLLRLAVGVVFLYHGAMKVNDFHQWTSNFSHMGFPGYVAYFIGPLEAVGGILLILGFLTRLFGLLLAGEMLIALVRVSLPEGPLLQVGRYSTEMLLSAISFVFFAYGAGPWSVDALRRRGSGRTTAR